MMTWEKFDEEIEESDERLRHMNKDYVYESYVKKIRPYFPVIVEFLNREEPATHTQLKGALNISGKVWNACRELFEEFQEVLSVEEDYIQMMADVMLLKGVVATENKNPKMVEMFQNRYNPLYKPKGQDVEVSLPKVEIVFSDAGVDEEYLEKFDPDIEVE